MYEKCHIIAVAVYATLSEHIEYDEPVATACRFVFLALSHSILPCLGSLHGPTPNALMDAMVTLYKAPVVLTFWLKVQLDRRQESLTRGEDVTLYPCDEDIILYCVTLPP